MLIRLLTILSLGVGNLAAASLTAVSEVSRFSNDQLVGSVKSDPSDFQLPDVNALLQSSAAFDPSANFAAAAKSIAQLSSVSGVHLGVMIAGRAASDLFDAGMSATSSAGLNDNYDVLSGATTGSFEWVYRLTGVLDSNSGKSLGLGDSDARVLFSMNGATLAFEESPDAGKMAINQLVTAKVPFNANVSQDVAFQLFGGINCTSIAAQNPVACSASSEFMNSADLQEFHVLDSQGNIIDSSVTLSTGSGFDYESVNAQTNIPEPNHAAVLLGAIAVIWFKTRRKLLPF